MLPDRNSASQSWPVSLFNLEKYPQIDWKYQLAIVKHIAAYKRNSLFDTLASMVNFPSFVLLSGPDLDYQLSCQLDP